MRICGHSLRALLLSALALTLSVNLFTPIPSVEALPFNNRTIGLTIDSTGWHDLSGSTNPPISVYRDNLVSMFLRNEDGATHQLIIDTPTPITSPLLTTNGQIVMFSFVAAPAGGMVDFTYCDAFSAACGIFQIKVPGDVNGDSVVNVSDLALVGASFLSSLSAGWNLGDSPYLDGRVDNTDLIIVSFYFLTTGPWPAPYVPDINGDGVVNFIDLGIVGSNFGASATPPFSNSNQGPDVTYDNVVNVSDLAIIGGNFLCTPATCP